MHRLTHLQETPVTPKQSLSASDLRFLRSVCALMAERVSPEAMGKVRVRDVLARQELAALRAASMTFKPSTPR